MNEQQDPAKQNGGVILDKFKLPVGSLVVDLALVFALVYGAGQITTEVANLTERVPRLEQSAVGMTPAAREAIARLQAQVEANQKQIAVTAEQAREDHSEVMLRLGRIETLLLNERRASQ
jgi:uncharacterized protein with PhoU and TrkA domain